MHHTWTSSWGGNEQSIHHFPGLDVDTTDEWSAEKIPKQLQLLHSFLFSSACRSHDEYQKTADWLKSYTKHRPQVAIICGTGLGMLADALKCQDSFPYSDIPGFPQSTGTALNIYINVSIFIIIYNHYNYYKHLKVLCLKISQKCISFVYIQIVNVGKMCQKQTSNSTTCV